MKVCSVGISCILLKRHQFINNSTNNQVSTLTFEQYLPKTDAHFPSTREHGYSIVFQ